MNKQQWGLAVNAPGGVRIVQTYPSEAAARNDPASRNGWVRVRNHKWVGFGPDAHWKPAGPWLATNPDDPLWGPRDTTGYTGPVSAGRDLATLLLFVVALIALSGAAGWIVWRLLAR